MAYSQIDKMITHQELLDTFDYDPISGLFHWVSLRGSRKPAGHTDKRGYITIRYKTKKYYAHRLAWMYIHGSMPTNQIDHINGITSDNSLSNLRDVTSSVNGKNQRLRKNNTSGHMGVHYLGVENKWVAYIKVNGKRIHLGRFPTKQSAVEARQKASASHGFHAGHGKVV